MTDNTRLPYELEEFAQRHGFSLELASVVLRANRRSKRMADLGAMIFKQAALAREGSAHHVSSRAQPGAANDKPSV